MRIPDNGVFGDQPAGPPPERVPVIVVDTQLRLFIAVAFFILTATALYFARDFALPVALAFLFALVLSPIVRLFRRQGMPEPITAVLLVLTILGALGMAFYSLSGPVSQWIADAPRISEEVRGKIVHLRAPIEAVVEATSEVEELTSASNDPTAQRVVVREPGLLSRAASGIPSAGVKVGITLVLLLFLLASGEMFYEKLVRALPTLSDKKRGLRIAKTVEREVSRYLFTITLINAGLGLAIGTSMWALGMPNPVLWGVVAAVLNYIPFLGGMVGITLVAAVALVSFDTLGYALLAPLVYFTWNFIEGQIVTPAVVGRRLEMNAVAVFLAIAFWGWLWGIVGALIAVPLLLTVKVLCDHVESLQPVGEFLGARNVAEPPEEAVGAKPG